MGTRSSRNTTLLGLVFPVVSVQSCDFVFKSSKTPKTTRILNGYLAEIKLLLSIYNSSGKKKNSFSDTLEGWKKYEKPTKNLILSKIRTYPTAKSTWKKKNLGAKRNGSSFIYKRNQTRLPPIRQERMCAQNSNLKRSGFNTSTKCEKWTEEVIGPSLLSCWRRTGIETAVY